MPYASPITLESRKAMTTERQRMARACFGEMLF